MKNLSNLPLLLSLSIIGLTSSCSPTEEVIFQDDFNTTDSYFEELTQNATHKEYGEISLPAGHLPKKWNFSWDYSYEGEWLQAFYCIPEGADYMEQAGRSATPGNYRAIANVAIPDDAIKYEIKFRQRKHDNDPVNFHLGTDAKGNGGVIFGYENQLPGTDHTVDTVYMKGDLGATMIPGKAYSREWADHRIVVDIKTKEIAWVVNEEELIKGVVEQLSPGGYFAISQQYERGTRYDDFVITVWR